MASPSGRIITDTSWILKQSHVIYSGELYTIYYQSLACYWVFIKLEDLTIRKQDYVRPTTS